MAEKPRHRFTELQLKLVLLEQQAAEYFIVGVNHLLKRELGCTDGYLASGQAPTDPEDLARYHRCHLWHGAHLHFDMRIANTGEVSADVAPLPVDDAGYLALVGQFWRRSLLSGASVALYYLHRCVARPSPLQESLAILMANLATIIGDYQSMVELVVWKRFLAKDLPSSVAANFELNAATAAQWKATNITAKKFSAHVYMFRRMGLDGASSSSPADRLLLDPLFWNALAYVRRLHDAVMALIAQQAGPGGTDSFCAPTISLVFTVAQLSLVLMTLNEAIKPNLISGKATPYPHISSKLRKTLKAKNPIFWFE